MEYLGHRVNLLIENIMEPERKQKTQNKKYFDKKYKSNFVDDDKLIRKAQTKQFRQKKREIYEEDESWKDWDYKS